jgi:telomere length regulation protein
LLTIAGKVTETWVYRFVRSTKLSNDSGIADLLSIDVVVRTLVEGAEGTQYLQAGNIGPLLEDMPTLDRRKVIFSLLRYFAETHLNKLGKCETTQSRDVIGGVITLLRDAVGKEEGKVDHLVSWLTSSSGAGLGDGVGIRRAVMAVVAQQRDALVGTLEKMIAQFGDALYIRHSPLLQQEAHAQALLLCAGYAHRLAPTKLMMMTRYGAWLSAISNRLSASQERARFLGMVVGEAITGLYEKGDKKLDFHQEETNGEEGLWYKELVCVEDKPGPVETLRTKTSTQGLQPKGVKAAPQPTKPQHTGPVRTPTQGFIIEELDDDESQDDDLVPYAKPDSDEEDSDDDATLVQSNKPKAPVYIRDLIRYLRDSDNYDHQKLALTTAPTLIRRKGNFGTEVREHAEELASLLIGLQDKFEIENFYNLRLQSMIALVVTQPEMMGQWFAKTFFDGDYSASQRAAILAVLGIGAREIAGFETSEYTAAASFPSKTLPDKVERLYLGLQPRDQSSTSSALKALPSNALDTMAQSLTQSFLAPLAAEAADKTTGPDVLKLSTFTSRLERQQDSPDPPNVKRKQTSNKPRLRAIPNTTAQILYTSFFSPLAARFQAALRSSSFRTRAIVTSQPHLLATYLRTLGIVAHAAGPGTLALPAMTAELWRLLLRARGASGGDVGVVRAILFALLALLEVNEGRMRDICAEMGSEVVETMEWVGTVFDGTRGDDGGNGEEGEVKMLAAAVLIRLRDGVEQYRALLVGDMIGMQ